MRRFTEIRAELGMDQPQTPPERKMAYFSYLEGQALEHATIEGARKRSKLVEAIVVNKNEIDAYHAAQKQLENQAFDLWLAELKKEHAELSEAQFNLCYSQAYARGHCYGYDEVASHMEDIVYFANKLLATVK